MNTSNNIHIFICENCNLELGNGAATKEHLQTVHETSRNARTKKDMLWGD